MSLKGDELSDELVPPANAKLTLQFYVKANASMTERNNDWKSLSEKEQEPFKQMAAQDRIRYKKEAREYKAAKYFSEHPEELEVQPLTAPELDLPVSVNLRELRLMGKEDLTDEYIDGVSGKTVKAINSTRNISTYGKVKDALKKYVAGEECK